MGWVAAMPLPQKCAQVKCPWRVSGRRWIAIASIRVSSSLIFLHFGRKCLWRQGFLESSHFSVDNFVDIPLVGRASPCAVVLWSLCLPKRHCLCRLMNQPLTLMPWIGCHFARMRPGEPAAVPAGPSVCISGAARAASRLNAGAARANSCARLRPARSHARAG